jgi:hypothetical protein
LGAKRAREKKIPSAAAIGRDGHIIGAVLIEKAARIPATKLTLSDGLLPEKKRKSWEMANDL